jgi:hypothetical protein
MPTVPPLTAVMPGRIRCTASGGCSHFITTYPGSSGPTGSTITMAFGQGALYGELGFGESAEKSSSKPKVIEALNDVRVLDIAAGNFFTLFLVRPGGGYSDLPRVPVEVESPEDCVVCRVEGAKDGVWPVECEKVSQGGICDWSRTLFGGRC